ncbi:MAG TPA: NUDIX domain-containing protein [Candidatus Thermoplasmatota archaeon]|jgi:ADP-ribose pyrophosphatase YjhB (NUDIX family)|nr:NUDIX domain-containing protein [Candidatus Thermoplasmatota archaeon]
MRGFAYYSPATDPPPGGLCLSAFAIVRRGATFLVGKPAPHARWKEWAPNWDIYDPKQLEQQYSLWRLPAAYLKEGEGPDDTARRIVLEQLGAAQCFVRAQRTYNFHDPSSRFPGAKHWDLCFVYEVDAAPAEGRALPWWRELRWVNAADLDADDFGSSIGDLARELGLVG